MSRRSGKRAHSLWMRAGGSALPPVQTFVRGGWSGGGRVMPASIGSSSGRSARDEASRMGKPSADGPFCNTLAKQMASSGQSSHPLCFCFSGQHGMSSDMSAICIVPPAGARSPATAGVASGAIANPIEIRKANKNCRVRLTSIRADISTLKHPEEEPCIHFFARQPKFELPRPALRPKPACCSVTR